MSAETEFNSLMEKAVAALALGDLMTAEAVAVKALHLNNRDPQALQLLGRCRYLYTINAMTMALYRLKLQGFDLRVAADVGAFHGLWTRALKRAYPESRVLMLEAQESCTPNLQATCAAFPGGVDYRIALLGGSPGQTVPFHIMATGSSIYRENTDVEAQTAMLTMSTLADVAAAAGYDHFDMIKLDVQGAELDVLNGAGDLLERAEIVLLETALVPYNIGAPCFSDVVKYMRNKGFEVFDIADLMRNDSAHQLYQCDLVFAKVGGRLSPWHGYNK